MTFVLLTGCRGAAYRDVYTQKMAGEIRNLEDQLYQADYENQVLNDRLSRAEMRASQVQVPADARRRTFMGKSLDENGNVINVAPEPREATPSKNVPSTIDSLEIETPLQPAPEPTTPKLPARPILPPTDAPEKLVPPAEAVPPGKTTLPFLTSNLANRCLPDPLIQPTTSQSFVLDRSNFLTVRNVLAKARSASR